MCEFDSPIVCSAAEPPYKAPTRVELPPHVPRFRQKSFFADTVRVEIVFAIMRY
jgi:hypothetical protein